MNNESRLRIPPLAAISTATASSPPPTAGPMDRAVDAVVRRVDVDSGAFADQQDSAVDQRLRNLGPGPRQDAAKGDPRHPHRFCGRLVVGMQLQFGSGVEFDQSAKRCLLRGL